MVSRDGTDTVHDVETLHFSDGDFDLLLDAPVKVFDADGSHLLASFSTIKEAVDFANANGGANLIEVNAGAYAESGIAITEAVTIRAVGGTVTLNTGTGNGFDIAPGAVAGAADLVRIEGFTIHGTGATGDTVGVRFSGAYEGTTDGAIELIATSASGFGQDGVAIVGGGSGLTVTIDGNDPATTGTTETAAFTGSGYQASSGGTGDILFFGFTGDAALRNIAVTGTTGTGVGAADHGIQFAGYDPADASIDHAIGNVTLDNVTVSGTYEKTLAFVQGYDDLSGLHFTGTQIGSASGTQTTWTGLYITGAPNNPLFTPDATPPSTLDLTGVTYAGGAFGTSLGFAQFGERAAVIVGTPTADDIIGTIGNEVFYGTTGDDTITSGGGNDLIIYNVGDGHDTVTDSAGTDTLALANFNANLTLSTAPATFTITESTTSHHLFVDTDGITAHEVDATGMDAIQVQLGAGGDAVALNGNLADAGIATTLGSIVVVGGAGADVLDASGLTSANAIATGPGGLGGGSDTFKAADVLANDNVDGGMGTDTADYSAATAGMTIDLAAGTATGATVNTAGGHDIITSFENAVGSGSNDSITGTDGANDLSGGAGDDVLTGGLGSDTLAGGTDSGTVAHHDIAVFSGSLADYTFHFTDTPGSVLVHNTSTGETDTVSGVEELQFAGGRSVLLVNAAGSSLTAIQQGVDATGTDDIVYVGAGTYHEQVQIAGHGHDGLQVLAVPGDTVTVQAPATLAKTADAPSDGEDIYGVVTVTNAANVTLSGINVDGNAVGSHASVLFVGIAYVDASGTVDHADVTGIRWPLDGGQVNGVQDGIGVYVENSATGALLPFTLSNSTIEDYQKNGVTVTHAGVTVTGNHVTGSGHQLIIAQNGIQVSDSSGSIAGNTVSELGWGSTNAVSVNDVWASGIIAFNLHGAALTPFTISGNTVTGAAGGAGALAALDLEGIGANETISVSDNTFGTVGHEVDFGIAAYGGLNSNPDIGANTYAVTAGTGTGLFFDPEAFGAPSSFNFLQTGSDVHDELHGSLGQDTLSGGGGNDLLDGRGGADALNGGDGDDIYLAQAADTVFETGGAGSGTDEVRTTDSFTLSANVENLTLLEGGNTSGTGNDIANVITGNSGNNTLEGLNGDDTLNGNAGIDTAVYRDAVADYDITTTTNGHGLVTSFSQVQEHAGTANHDGDDTLTSIERLTFQSGTPGTAADDVTLDLNQSVQLFDGSGHLVGTFDHIQDAIAAAGDGYTVRLAAGTYDEFFDIDKNITILGANSGASGTGARSPESSIHGQVTVSAAHSSANQVTLDGVQIYNTSDSAHPFVGLQVNSAADITITNSVFYSPVANGSSTVLDRAILLPTNATGTIDIDHNLFTGASQGAFSTASWTTAIWSDGAQAAATIDHNTFEFVRTAINADDFDHTFAITNNTFRNSGSGVSLGGANGGQNAEVSAITSIHDNTFTNVDTDFNLQNITAPGQAIGFDLTATNNHTGGTSTGTVLGGANGDTVTGSTDNDILIGNNGNDLLNGGDGDDALAGGGNDDTLHGGAGNDALYGGARAGTDSGKDTATYDDARSHYTIAMQDANNDGFIDSFTDVTETTVAGTNEGHDTLSGIEVLSFADQALDLTAPVQLFHGTTLAGTFTSIQDAVNASGAGDTVLINGNIRSTFHENVTVSAGITLRGIGSVTIDGDGGSALTITGGGAGQSVTVDNIDLTAGNSGTSTSVALVTTTAQYDHVTLENGDVTGGAYAGFFLDNATGVAGVTIANAHFSGAALTDSLSSGESEIYFHQYNGDVALTNVTVTAPTTATGLEYGIQMVGASSTIAMGEVTFDNVTVNGTFVKAGVAVDTFADVNGLTFVDHDGDGPLSGLTVNVSAGFGAINYDNIGGTLDLSTAAVTASNTNPSPTAFDIDFQGTGGNETFIGNDNDNFFNGKGGDDTLTGGSGNDVFLHAVGDGNDVITGGAQTAAGADVLLVAGQGGFVAATVDANETINIHLNDSGHIDQIDGGGSVDGIELTALDMDGGIDTLDYSGNTIAVSVDLGAGSATGFTGVSGVIMPAVQGVENVVGGSGGDTLIGSSVANVLVGGDGADSLTGGGGNDTLYGGTATTDAAIDTANFSGNSTDHQITVDPFQATDDDGVDATVSGGADGTDTLHGVELLHFANTTIDLTERVFLTDHDGHLIGTFHNIQDAVNASDASGEHILVRNGLYTEQVVIGTSHDNLEIIGQSKAGVVIQSPADALAVTGQAAYLGVAVRANVTVDGSAGVSISNLTVDGDFAGARSAGSGADEITGIAFLHAGGTINNVTVERTSDPATPALFGVQHGSGILVDNGGGPQQDITISSSSIHDFQKTGMLIWNADVTIRHNDIEGIGPTDLTAQNGLQIGGSQGIIGGATAGDANTFEGIGYTGADWAATDLIAYEPTGALTVQGNTFAGTGLAAAETTGIDLSDVAAGHLVTITDNAIGTAGHGIDFGIVAYTYDAAKGLASDPAISGNTFVVEADGEGIYLDPEDTVIGGPFTTDTAFTETGTQFTDELHGSNGADNFSGGTGDDILQGRGGADIINGDGGDDTILWNAGTIGDGNDTIDGGDDHDELDVATNGHSITLTAAGDHFTLSQDDSPTTNTATVSAVEDVDITLSGGETVTITGDFSGTGIAKHTITINGGAGTSGETVDASGISTAYPVDVVFTGSSHDDTFKSGSGNDTFHGGAGNDTAVFHDDAAAAIITWDGSAATVTTAQDGTDHVDGVGRLTFADGHRVWLVNDNAGSEYTTLAQLFDNNLANGEAAAGDIIMLADGTYIGDVTIDEAVTIRGANAGTLGTAGRAAESIIQGQVRVTAGAIIDGVEILNTSNNDTQFIGVRIQNTSADVTIRDSVFYSAGPNGNAEDRGINMDTTVHGHVTIAGNLFTGARQAAGDEFSTANWQRGVWSDGGQSQLDITGNRFDHIRSGLNLDGLNNSTTVVSGNDFKFDGTGIAVGGNYVGSPAALNLTAIHDNTFNNTPEDVSVQNLTTAVTFNATDTNNTATEAGTPIFLVDGGQGADTLTGTAGTDILIAHSANNLAGNDNNTLAGKGGADFLVGAVGTGIDTATYAATLTAANIAVTTATTDANPLVPGTQAGWTVDGGAEGIDTLSDIERVADGAGHHFLLVGNGGFTTIQAAVDASAMGDTIIVADGTYIEQVDVSGHGHDNLTIRAAAGATVIVQAPTALVQTTTVGSGRVIDGVITVENALNVQIVGIDVDGAGHGNGITGPTVAGNAPNFVGIIYRNASGDLTDVDVTGIHDVYPGGTTADDFPMQSGNQRGVGVQVDNDGTLAFSMHGGSIDDFQKNAAIFNHADLDITGVTITGGGAQTVNAQNGIQVSNSTGTIDHNTIGAVGYAGPQNVYSGEILAIGNTDLDITHNTITGTNLATTNAKVVGIFVDGATGGEISGNSVDHADIGIGIYDSVAGISVHDNAVTNLDLHDPSAAAGVDFEPTATVLVGSWVEGTDNTDFLLGTAGSDTLSGLGGDDYIQGGGGADILSGGAGDDAFIIASPADHPATKSIDGGGDVTGDAILFTSTHAGDTLVLSSQVTGIETIQISDNSGDATGTTALNIDGSATTGDFALVGNAGDNILSGGSGSNAIDGGAGNDTADYSAATAGLSITLSNGASTAGFADGYGHGGIDTLANIENVTGGGGNDTLNGDVNANILTGNGGNDILSGFGGADRLIGGAGHDQLFGGDGNDVLIGGTGPDSLSGGNDADQIVYAARADGGTATAPADADFILGFSIGQHDTIAFNFDTAHPTAPTSGFFAGLALSADFNESGHVGSNHFVISTVDETFHYGGGQPGQATFVLDSTGNEALWFDADGNGSLSDPNDVKIATFDGTSSLSGITNHDLLLI